MKKSTRKSAGKRAAKDLSPRKSQDTRGGSQSTGAGAGKATFNPFSITRKIDKASP